MLFGKFFLLFEIAPLLVFILADFFGMMKARYAFVFGFAWFIGMVMATLWLLGTDYWSYGILAFALTFASPWVGVLSGIILSSPVPFAETPAGMTKQAYDKLPEEQKEKIRKTGRFGLRLVLAYFTKRLDLGGYANTADFLKSARRAI